MSDPVLGSLQITSCSMNDGDAAYENLHLSGVVTAPELAPTAVEHRCTAPSKRWPQPGQTVPVTVDRADPSRLRVEWDRMPSNRDAGLRQAQALAASMNGQPGAATQQTVDPANPESWWPGMVNQAGATLQQSDANVTVLGAPGRAVPGAAGGGLTPEHAAAAGQQPGMHSATATVLAAHEVAVPAGMPGGGAAGTVDLTLDVAMPDGVGFTSTTRIGFSTLERRARVATVGAVLPVFVDPDARDRIAIDTTNLF